MTPRTLRIQALTAVSIGLLALSACNSGATADNSAAGTNGGKVTLTLATFNQFGYEDLITEYQAAHPNITIRHKKAATSNEARDNLNTRLAAGSGLSDIEAVEVDWLPELMQYSDKFTDLKNPDVEGRWLDWKTKAATDKQGRLIGYGTDSGPEAICYRADLFKAAGLPSERGEVAALLGTTWDSYFAAGKQFAATSKVPWFDSLGATWQGMINQVESTYENPDGTVIATTNPKVKETFDKVVKAGIDDKLSARLQQWSDDWVASFKKDGFATMLCPGWMVGVIEGNAKGVKGWDVANTFPGGGGNWGKHPEEARALAAWLTAPEQQIKAFKKVGAFPSQQAALDSPDLASVKVAFFNDAPTGQIFADRAKAVTVTPYKGTKYFPINDAMQQALTRIEDGSSTPAASWDKFVADVQALG
jgi:cellobiose transport system substrate-binding protein